MQRKRERKVKPRTELLRIEGQYHKVYNMHNWNTRRRRKRGEGIFKVMFLGEVEIMSGIKPRFGIMDFSTNDAIKRLWFSL